MTVVFLSKQNLLKPYTNHGLMLKLKPNGRYKYGKDFAFELSLDKNNYDLLKSSVFFRKSIFVI